MNTIWILWECIDGVDDTDTNQLTSVHRTEDGAYAAMDRIIAEDDELSTSNFVVYVEDLED